GRQNLVCHAGRPKDSCANSFSVLLKSYGLLRKVSPEFLKSLSRHKGPAPALVKKIAIRAEKISTAGGSL
ncbi:hypothetical protein, partial [uncultured Akkermansia sp.]|uniref:hypothetical protein n=1 Tax=uncultured Akkermansia sp. TaxID=512294 RepID=UPI00261F018D